MGLLDWLGDSLGLGGGGNQGMSMDLPPGAMRGMPPMQDFGNAPPPVSPQMMAQVPPGIAPPEAATPFMSGPMPPVQAMDGPMGRPAWGPDSGSVPITSAPNRWGPDGGSLPPAPPQFGPDGGPLPQQGLSLPPQAFGPDTGPMPPQAGAGGGGMPTPSPAAPPLPSRTIAPAPAPMQAGPMPGAGGMPPPLDINRSAAAFADRGPVRDDSASGGPIGRALGLSPEKARMLRNSLSGGLKAVSENWNKPGLAAFAGGAAGALKGGEEGEAVNDKRKDSDYDKRIKALNAAISAKKEGNEASYKTNYLKYQISASDKRIDLAKQKMANGAAGRGNAWNKPESQKIIDIENAVAKDRGIMAMQKQVEKAILPEERAKAQTELDRRIVERRAALAGAMGISPQKLAAAQANPFGSKENPHDLSGISKDDFINYVKPGDWFINPANGKLLRAKSGPAPASPAPTPLSPSAPASAASGEDDDED